MGRQPQPGGLKHIHFDRCNWRVQDKTNKINHRGFTTQYDAWVWRQAERAARGLPLIDDARPEWFDRSGDVARVGRELVRYIRNEYSKILNAASSTAPIDAPEMVEYKGLDALINTGYQNPHIPADYAERLASDARQSAADEPTPGTYEYHYFIDRAGRAYKQAGDTLRPINNPLAVEITTPSPPEIETSEYQSPPAPPSIAIADHTIDIPEVLTVASRNQLVIADLHCPYHSGRALESALNTARQRFGDAFDIIIAGDLFDFAELSRHPKDEREEATEVVFSTTGYVLCKIAEWVPGKVYILPGNHDRRMARKTGLPLQIDDLLAVACKPQGIPANIAWTNNDYLIIGHADPARRWLIGHPRNYSQQGGFTAARLAQIRQINVITAHDHTVGQQMSVDGRWRGISCGHMTRPDAHAYKRASLSIHREWSAGFVLLADGVAECHTLDSV